MAADPAARPADPAPGSVVSAPRPAERQGQPPAGAAQPASGGAAEAALGGPPVAVVLAAGKGTRMRSALPKVLHRVAGRPLLAWVLDAARAAGCARILVVVGHGAEQVRAELGAGDLTWVLQEEQRGTGHALAQAAPAISGPARLLVLSGDVPLVTPATLARLLSAAAGGWGALATAPLEHPGANPANAVNAPLGAIAADRPHEQLPAHTSGSPHAGTSAAGNANRLVRIVEAADASPAELALRTVNAGLYALPAPAIFSYLERLRPANAQGELYLTDAVTAAAGDGQRVALVPLADPLEAQGVNDRRELAAAHRRLLDRHLDALMRSGVGVLEPARTVVEPAVRVGPDTILHPGVSLLGRTAVGSGCVLHQGVWVRDSRIGDGVEIGPYCVLDGVEVESGRRIGPGERLAAGR
jgi:bifunctional UDP-N-acetylglucosamine pyrophosphorylase/glucosamine-1-phosphate N-acetyltransferase